MPGSQYTASQYQTANPYAALVATAGPEHDRRSSSSDSPLPSGSSSSVAQQHNYGSPEQSRAYGIGANRTLPAAYAALAAHRDYPRAGPVRPVAHTQPVPLSSSLAGVPESVAVQETAFRQGQRERGSASDQVPANPFAQHFNQLWAAFYKLGKECGEERAPTPVNPSQQNFAWPVLINPYTQSIKNPNGSLDPAWTRKMITVALDCMHKLIRITCRRNNGWEKTVADIPLPAQEALSAFPDLAKEYEQLKCDAEEARAGGRPYGY